MFTIKSTLLYLLPFLVGVICWSWNPVSESPDPHVHARTHTHALAIRQECAQKVSNDFLSDAFYARAAAAAAASFYFVIYVTFLTFIKEKLIDRSLPSLWCVQQIKKAPHMWHSSSSSSCKVLLDRKTSREVIGAFTTLNVSQVVVKPNLNQVLLRSRLT